MILPEVYWVREPLPRLLAFGARPRSGDWLDEQIRGYRELGFRHVVSLLEPSEVQELALGEEAQLCASHGIRFHTLPIPDRGTPQRNGDTVALVHLLAEAIGNNEAVFVHCRAGIGRSGSITALILLRLGEPFESIFPSLTRARGVSVPDTEQQEHWVRSLRAAVSSN